MNEVLLVRHATCEDMEQRLNGRRPGVRLTPQGRDEAARLGRELTSAGVSLILSSPRERCLETADCMASYVRLPVDTLPELDEVDFGDWTGLHFDQLALDPRWALWNTARATATPPGGEAMANVQARMRQALAHAANFAKRGTVMIVSHAEPIRAALADLLGFSLDNWARLQISPSSVTILDGTAGCVRAVNQTFR